MRAIVGVVLIPCGAALLRLADGRLVPQFGGSILILSGAAIILMAIWNRAGPKNP